MVSILYTELLGEITTNRYDNESFRDFESRFGAQLSRFNALASHTAVVDSISAPMLFANASVVSSQRVSIFGAASPSFNATQISKSTDELLKLVHYNDVATVIRNAMNMDPMSLQAEMLQPGHCMTSLFQIITTNTIIKTRVCSAHVSMWRANGPIMPKTRNHARNVDTSDTDLAIITLTEVSTTTLSRVPLRSLITVLSHLLLRKCQQTVMKNLQILLLLTTVPSSPWQALIAIQHTWTSRKMLVFWFIAEHHIPP